jgi:hypothetical protein
VGYAGSPHYDKYSYNYMAATATATATAQAQVPSQAPPALGSRIPRPVSSMPANSALPPRPPRAARREMALQLPPGAGPALPAPRATTFVSLGNFARRDCR